MITPLDPASPQGVEMSERLTKTLANIRAAIAERKRLAERADREPVECQPAQQAA